MLGRLVEQRRTQIAKMFQRTGGSLEKLIGDYRFNAFLQIYLFFFYFVRCHKLRKNLFKSFQNNIGMFYFAAQ